MTLITWDLLAEELRQRATPPMIAIDGSGGSGKSTLAEHLRNALPGSQVVHVDDFYRPMPDADRDRLSAEQGADLYFDVERLVSEVLVPLHAGRPARYRKYDWPTERVHRRQHLVRSDRPVILEGVHAADLRCRDYVDVIVFVDTPPEMRTQRMLERGENDPAAIQRWAAAEDHYFTTHGVREAAHWIVDGAVNSSA